MSEYFTHPFASYKNLVVVLACAALAACSGGGGGAGKTATGTTTSYSSDGSTKIITTNYSDGTSTQNSLTGTASVSWASDHITKTTTYSFSDNTTNTVTQTVQPTTVAPTLAAAVYPTDWSSGTSTGTVTKAVTAPVIKTYADGYSEIPEDGTALKPFNQSTLTPHGATGTGAINDPNAFVSFVADAKPINNNTPTPLTYDLRWGTPDPAGPKYASYFANQAYQLPTSTQIFGAVLSGNGCQSTAANVTGCGAILPIPSSDVTDAWKQGWTGKGKNILIWDDIGETPVSPHPMTVQTIAQRYAWESDFYGMSYNYTAPIYPTVVNLDGSNSAPNASIPIAVINMSWGANLKGQIGRDNTAANPWTVGELLTQRSNYQPSFTDAANLVTNAVYKGSQNGGSGSFNLSDAVLVKAASNDSIDATSNKGLDAQYEPLNYWLSRNASDVVRLLIVGALDDIGTPTARVSIAYYSDIAGTDPIIQSRFLTESGKSVFSDPLNDYYDGKQLTSGVGTSYAAPRVAAYAAIVRQKFPNVTAVNTADILLATARYDTLACYPNCDKSIYGQGEASLSRALAPVGYLR